MPPKQTAKSADAPAPADIASPAEVPEGATVAASTAPAADTAASDADAAGTDAATTAPTAAPADPLRGLLIERLDAMTDDAIDVSDFDDQALLDLFQAVAVADAAPAPPAAEDGMNLVEAAEAADVLAEDVLTWRLRGQLLTVVTTDGRKIEAVV